MPRKRWLYLGFFATLAVGFYFALTLIIPDFAKRKVNPVSTVRPFAFTNQDGKNITEKDVEGKVYVAAFFFTTCKTICPIMNNYMKLVHDEFKNNNGFLILSHTSDPQTDSVAQIKKYADSLGVNTIRWMFLTGRKDSLYNAARVSYTLDDPANNLQSINDQFMHTQHWALVDKEGYVRKIFDGLKESEVKDLIKEAHKLLKEMPE